MIPNENDNILLQKIIDYNLSYKKDRYASLELIIRPECNQKCKYCYLHQYEHESYPDKVNKIDVINNFQMFINYLIEKKYVIANLDLFAGDLFFDNLFFDLISILEKYYIFLDNEFHNLLWEQKFVIMIPCNMSFCKDDEKIIKVKNICNDFFKKYHIKILFSYSTDGIYALDSREQENLDETYFDKIFAFCEEMGWGVHPMLGYENVNNIIKNYEWFKQKYQQFRIKDGSNLPYFLEVRNDGWNEESLEKYKEFLIYYLNDIFHNYCHSSLEEFFNNFYTDYYINNNKYIYKEQLITGLGNLHFRKHMGHSLGCSIGHCDLIVNIQNLSIVPCHRLAYPELSGGKFIYNNNKITDIKANEQLNTYLSLAYYNPDVSPACINCKYNAICMKGCLGSQYEKFSDANIAIPSVCKLLQTKYDTIINYFHSIGLFHFIFKNYPNYPDNKDLKLLLLSFNYNEYSIYK